MITDQEDHIRPWSPASPIGPEYLIIQVILYNQGLREWWFIFSQTLHMNSTPQRDVLLE